MSSQTTKSLELLELNVNPKEPIIMIVQKARMLTMAITMQGWLKINRDTLEG